MSSFETRAGEAVQDMFGVGIARAGDNTYIDINKKSKQTKAHILQDKYLQREG